MSFQKNLGDIPTQVVTGTARPSTHVAEAISTLGAVAGDAVQGFQKNKLRSDVQESADIVTAIDAAKKQKGSGIFSDDGKVNTEGLSSDLQKQIARVQANAGEKFGRIANAVKQGATSQNAAALETEAMVRNLVSQTPGFSQEIKQMARELVGFDPTGFALRQILDVDAPKSTRVTAQQKRIEEAQVMQDGLHRIGKDVPLDTLLGNLALRDQLNLEKESNDALLANNTYSVRQWAQKSFVERGPDLNQVMSNVVGMGANGGITDNRQYVNAVLSQREADKAAFRQEVQLRGGMETGEMQAIESQIDAQYKPLIDSINNNKLGDVLADRIDLIAKVNQMWGKQATPRLTRIIDAYGPQIGGQLLEMMSNIADPKQFELVYQFDPALKELVQGGGMTQSGVADGVEKVIDKVLRGEELTSDDLSFRNMTEIMVTQPGNTDLREGYVSGLGTSSPIRAVSILSTKVPRVEATETEVKFMKDSYNIYVGTPATEGVPGNLITGMANEILSLDPQGLEGELKAVGVVGRTQQQAFMAEPVSPTGQTKIVIPFDPTGQGKNLDFQTDSMKRMQPFLDAVILKGYAPDLGVSKEAFANSIMERVNAQVKQLRADKIEAIRLAKEEADEAKKEEDEVSHEN